MQIPMHQIQVVDHDTDLIRTGSGTHGSRSLRMAGTAIHVSATALMKKAKEHAATHLEVSVPDIDYAMGQFFVPGTDHHIGLFELAQVLKLQNEFLICSHEHFAQQAMFASGSQLCEVEIDPETGQVKIERFVSVSDPGTLVNPMIAEGQVHGGITQGLGHAVFENVVYDRGSGQLITGSFMDYAIPRADSLPMFETYWNPVATRENPLGVKGAGEIGTMGAPAAMMNAIENALEFLDGARIQMPATSEQIWQIIRASTSTATD